jgi:hypothetical protein
MDKEELEVLKNSGFVYDSTINYWESEHFFIKYNKGSYYPYRVVRKEDREGSDYTNFSDALTAATPATEPTEVRTPPKRYDNEELDVEAVEIYYRVYGKEALLNALRFNILKYRLRMGNKEGESLEKEMSKVKDYLAIKKEYENKN